jgi:thiol-disulfide isomerase/thioredoxin
MIKLFAALLLSLVLVTGCVSQTSQPTDEAPVESQQQSIVKESQGVMQPAQQEAQQAAPKTVEPSVQNVQVQFISKNYARYSKAAFDKARSEGKVIFLDFYANWCPICKTEHPHIVNAFNEISEDVIAFQVHYNDDETNEDDRNAAREYQVPYQHTKVIIGKDGNIALKTLEAYTDKEQVKKDVTKVV